MSEWMDRAHKLIDQQPADKQADLAFTFYERAAFGEYDGGLSRDDAEKQGYEQIEKVVQKATIDAH